MTEVVVKKALMQKRKPDTWTNWIMGIDREWDVREMTLVEVDGKAILSWRVEGEDKERNRVTIHDAKVLWSDDFGSPCVQIETKGERDLYVMAIEKDEYSREVEDQKIKEMREWYFDLATRSLSKADVKKQMTNILTLTEKDLKNPFSEAAKQKAEEERQKRKEENDKIAPQKEEEERKQKASEYAEKAAKKKAIEAETAAKDAEEATRKAAERAAEEVEAQKWFELDKKLRKASEDCDVVAMRELLAAGAVAHPDQKRRMKKVDEYCCVMEATRSGNVEVIQVFIDLGADLNVVIEGETAVMIAFNSGRGRIVQILIKGGSEPPNNWLKPSCFESAVKKCQFEIVQIYLEESIDPATLLKTEYFGSVQILCVALSGDYSLEILEYLIDKAATLNVTWSKETLSKALELVVERDLADALPSLVKAGAKPVEDKISYEDMCISRAARLGSKEVLLALVTMGASVETVAANFSGNRCLLEAIINKHEETALTLLEAGANPMAIEKDGKYGRTKKAIDFAREKELFSVVQYLESRGYGLGDALFEAAKKGDDGEVKKLLDRGASVEIETLGSFKGENYSKDATPLLAAVRTACSDEKDDETRRKATKCAQLLLDAKADVNCNAADDEENSKRGYNNGTPLSYAAEADNFELCKILHAAGVDLNKPGHYFRDSALTLACSKKSDTIAKWLVDIGASLNSMNTPPLIEAMIAQKKDLAHYILNKEGSDLDINAVKDMGNVTALNIAVAQKYEDIVKILIAKGADLNIADKYGATPLITACQWGLVEISLLLIQKGADVKQEGRFGSALKVIEDDKKDKMKAVIKALNKKGLEK